MELVRHCKGRPAETDRLHLRRSRNHSFTLEYVKQRQLTRLDPAVAGMIASKKPSIVEDIDDLAGVSPNYSAWKNEGIASIVTLPLVSESEVFGLIGAGSSSIRQYNKAETDSMAILATQAAAAITGARLFEQLREANKVKDEFFSTLSHELRTPLTPILGWTHLLKPFASHDPRLAQGLDTIERNAHQLSTLIKDLLDLTRIINNKIELDHQPTDLAVLLKTVVSQMRAQAEARGVTIELSLPAEETVSDVDRTRVEQIVSNLLENAVKFTPGPGRIEIVLKRENREELGASPCVVIEIVDTGIGIDRAFLPLIFERFTQAENGVKRRLGGLGLGLAITRAMVEAHGGTVLARSDGSGHGSRFTVRLPMMIEEVQRPKPDAGVAGSDQEQIGNLGLRLLIIEDSVDTLDVLRLWLSTFGCEVLVATDSMEGMRLAIEASPDLIISDIGMPDMDGYDLMRTLRSIPGLEEVPSIALTGYARESDRELALAAGYTAHLTKPANMQALLQLIKRLTTRRQ